MNREHTLLYEWLRIGFAVATAMRWYRLSDWLWYKKDDQFTKRYPREMDYYKPSDKKGQPGWWVIHNGW